MGCEFDERQYLPCHRSATPSVNEHLNTADIAATILICLFWFICPTKSKIKGSALAKELS